MNFIYYKLFPPTNEFLTPFEFTSCLGQGSFGVVFEANGKSWRPTAVKFLFPSEGTEKEQQQTLRECELALDCRHRNVVKTIKVATEKLTVKDIEKIFKNMAGDEKCNTLRDMYVGKATRNKTVEAVCIQMELCGENLRQWLGLGLDANEKFVHSKQRTILRNIIDGLKYIHDKKIIHRDLKPENVMFSYARYTLPVKIGDFGLCRKIRSDGSTLTSRMGTADYMAPEVSTNRYSFQADLYSLGLVIWEVAQRIPFQNRKSMFERLVIDKEEDLVVEHPHIPGIREIIIGLTKRNVNDRFKSIDDFLEIAERLEYSGKKYTAMDSDELKLCLKNVTNSGWIQLTACEYVGVFHLKQNNVKICGVEGSVLKLVGNRTPCLKINGDECSITNVTFVTGIESKGIELWGSNNEIRNVKFMSGSISLDVYGSRNHLQNLNISNSESGIRITGYDNTVKGVEIESVSRYGILVDLGSNENSLSYISGRNVKIGIQVFGSRCNISNVNLIKNSTERYFYGVSLSTSYTWLNRIKNLTCSGYESTKDDWGLQIRTPECSVENSACGPVFVGETGWNATLTNIECGELIDVHSDGVKLIKCRGKKLEALKEVTLTDCNFDITISP